MPPQRVYSKTTGIHNSLETISSTRKIRPKIAPNHANGGRVTRGGFDMYAITKLLPVNPCEPIPRRLRPSSRRSSSSIFLAFLFQLRPDFRLLATPQTLDVVMMAQQNET
ncbi:Uncharacterised protein [Salmonella enterica subsp. enterica serovar Hartford]|nr:Uncharacterised protein [Salmonella enterica subsp. enterica serovar Hartford]